MMCLMTLLLQAQSEQYVDLGLPSGTLWKANNEAKLITFKEAFPKYTNNLPTKEQFEELKNKCVWTWYGKGYKVIGPNGNFIVMPTTGFLGASGDFYQNNWGQYWSSTLPPDRSGCEAWTLSFSSATIDINYNSYSLLGFAVRLVKKP